VVPEEKKRRAQAAEALGGIDAADLKESMRLIGEHIRPYRELLVRSEQRSNLRAMLVGLTSDLERKSVEPIAVMHGLSRKVLQHFVGGSRWAWEPLMDRLRHEVTREIGGDGGSLVFDGSSTPKKGTETVGVARQWCGRLGKQDNCVVGVYAAYVGRDDAAALVESELFVPEVWTKDEERRQQVYMPPEVTYRTQPKIATDMLARLAGKLPFTWVLADDEFGRTQAFRDQARALGKSYVLDVPENTQMRRIGEDGRLCLKRWEAREIIKTIRSSQWKYFHVRDGEKRPIEVWAAMLTVVTHREDGSWVPETFVVIETLDRSQRWTCLAHAPPDTPLSEFVRQAGLRHRIEEVFGEAKGEVGLDHFETRTWQGWHHHMTLCLIANWFLLREKRRLGKKSPGPHRQHDPQGDRPAPLPRDAQAISRHPELPPPPQRGLAQEPLRRTGPGRPAATCAERLAS